MHRYTSLLSLIIATITLHRRQRSSGAALVRWRVWKRHVYTRVYKRCLARGRRDPFTWFVEGERLNETAGGSEGKPWRQREKEGGGGGGGRVRSIHSCSMHTRRSNVHRCARCSACIAVQWLSRLRRGSAPLIDAKVPILDSRISILLFFSPGFSNLYERNETLLFTRDFREFEFYYSSWMNLFLQGKIRKRDSLKISTRVFMDWEPLIQWKK